MPGSTHPAFLTWGSSRCSKVACGQNVAELKAFAERWGWEETESDWRKVIERDDVDIVDISVPTYLHRDIAVAAAQAGKHIFCEKPFALTLAEAQAMYDAAKEAGIVHYLNHNYRRCPAVMLAKRLIDEGKIGQYFPLARHVFAGLDC